MYWVYYVPVGGGGWVLLQMVRSFVSSADRTEPGRVDKSGQGRSATDASHPRQRFQLGALGAAAGVTRQRLLLAGRFGSWLVLGGQRASESSIRAIDGGDDDAGGVHEKHRMRPGFGDAVTGRAWR